MPLLKAAHVLSAAVVFGTGLGIAFFTWFGCRASIRAGDSASSEVASTAALEPGFHRMFRWWFALGTLAFAAVIAIYWLMLAKPLPVAVLFAGIHR